MGICRSSLSIIIWWCIALSAWPIVLGMPGGISNNLTLWLNAQNTSTMFQDSCGGTPATADGHRIACWQDASGNSHDFTASGNIRPTLKTDIRAINFNSVLAFDGSEDYLEDADGEDYINGLSEFSTFVVVNSDVDSADRYIFNSENDVGNREAPWGLRFDDVGALSGIDNTFKTGINNGTPTLYEGNEGGITSANPLLASVHWTSGEAPTLYVDARSIALHATTTKNGVLAGADYTRIGHQAGHSYWDGTIAELVHYSVRLNETAQHKIESYLAVKYGITFGYAVNYVDSDNTTIYATNTTHVNYSNDIAGMGYDSASGLNQTQSQSVNSDSIVTMRNASEQDDNEFLMWGNDNETLNEITSNMPLEYATRLGRTWRVDKTGDLGTVTVVFNLSGLSITGVNTQDFTLIIDEDTNFGGGATQVSAAGFSDSVARFELVNFSGHEFFTLITSDDDDAPEVTNLIPSSGSRYNVSSSIEVGADVSDDLSFVDTVYANITYPNGTVTNITLDSTGTGKYNSSFVLPVLAGNYTLQIIANDSKGNVNDTETSRFLVLLNTPLDITPILAWYDAADNTTLFTDDSCSAQVTADYDQVLCWQNKANASNATVPSGSYGARYRSTSTEKISSSTTLRFNKTNETLYETGIDIRASTTEDITLFAVYRPRSDNTSDQGQAVWGNDDGSWDRFYYSLFSESVPLGTDGIDDGLISLGGASQGLAIDGAGIVDTVFLLTAVYDGNMSGGTNSGPINGSQIYFDGNLQTKFTDESHATAAQTQLFLGRDGDNGHFDGDIAEIIVYDKVLNLCQIELVNNYLGGKYGKDFSGISNSYGYSSPHNNDVNGISEFIGNCSISTETTSAQSSIATVFNPSSLDVNDSLTFAHDDAGFSLLANVPENYSRRLSQSWRVDVDNTPGNVSLSFDLSTTGITTAGVTFALIIDSNINFSDASVTTELSIEGSVLTFTEVNFSDGEYFTLALNEKTPTISFVSPTPNNLTSLSVDHFVVNITSSTITSDHYTFVDVDRSLLTWLRMDEVNGSNDPTDLGILGLNGSLEGTIINSSGRFGDAAHFDGADDYIDLPDFNTDLSNGFSVCAWVYWNSLSESWSRIMDFGQGQADDNILFAHEGTTNNLAFEIYLGGSGGGRIDAPSAVITNIWQHYCVTQNSSGDVSIYVNGTNAINGSTSVPANVNRQNAYIGRSNWGSDGYFNGAIDEFLIFNRTLSAEEVRSLHNASQHQYVNNFSFLVDGNHTFIGHTVDINAKKNRTGQRRVIVDTTPPSISFNAGTKDNNSFVNQNYVFVNVTVTEINEANSTFRLFNSTFGLLNETNYTTTQRDINFTSLSDAVYYYNVTARDKASNTNTTETRKITIDTRAPSVSLIHPSGQTFNTSLTITINATVTDTNLDTVLANITYPNASFALLTMTNLSGDVHNASFTIPVIAGTYNVTIIANDSAGNVNDSEQSTFVASLQNPSEISNLRAWYDAADNSTLYTDDGCSTPVSADDQEVRCWQDKSSYGHNATSVSGEGIPRFAVNQFNGHSVLNFSKTEDDTLRHELASQYTSDFTIFTVIQSRDTSPNTFESFFSNGDEANASHFQIDYVNASRAFRYGADTKITFENFSNEIKLYSVTNDGSTVVLYSEGEEANISSVTNEGRLFEHYRINQNRVGNQHHDSRIAEIILYDRVLNACELEMVNIYLGDKYGRDFFGVEDSYSHGAPHNNDVNGIGRFPGNCSVTVDITTATSGFVTISNATSLQLNDSLTIGHDNGGITLSSDAPTNYSRISQSWRADEDDGGNGDGDGVGLVTVVFDLSSNTSLLDYNTFALLIDEDGTFNNATLSYTGTVDANTIRFTNVNFTNGDYFTLGLRDTTNPSVVTVSPLNSTHLFGSSVTISANVTDIIGVNTVLANISYPNGTNNLLTLSLSSAPTYSTSLTAPSLAGFYNVTFIANDTTGNTNDSETTNFTVRELSSPLIFFNDPPTPVNTSYVPNNYFQVSVNSSDLDTTHHYTFTDFDNSLVLWVRMDEVNSSGDPGDISGNNNNGSLVGDAKINSSGVFGDGSHYDGSGDYIEIPDSSTLKIGTSDFTYSLWFNSNEVPSSSKQLFCKRVNSAGNYEVQLESGGKIRSWIGDVGGSATNIDSVTVISANTWYHVTITRGGGTMYMYVNGVLENQTSSTHNVSSTSSLFIGRDAPSAAELFDGSVDEVLIFNRSFNASEVLALYNATANQYLNNVTLLSEGNHTFIGYAVNANGKKNQTELRRVTIDTTFPQISYNAGTAANNSFLAQEYVFINVSVTEINEANITFRLFNSTFGLLNETNYTTAQRNINFTGLSDAIYYYNVTSRDHAGNANTTETRKITLDNANPTVIADAPIGQTVLFGTSIEVAANVSDVVSVDTVLANITYPNSTVDQLTLTAATGDKYNLSYTAPSLSGLYTVRFIANDTSGKINASVLANFSARNTSTPSIFFITPPTPAHTAYTSENRITVSINSSDIDTSDHYTFVDFDDRLTLWMRFDDVNGSGDPTDISTKGNNGSLSGDAKINGTGRFGDGLHLDGDGDFVNLPASNQLIPNGDVSWTFSTWFNAKNIGSGDFDNRIITVRNAPSLSAVTLTLGQSDQIQFFYRDGGGSGTTTDIRTISTNTWYHYVASYNGSDFFIYVNGELNATITDSMASTSSDTARIGANPAGSSEFFNGSIDEILLFDRSLSAADIQSLYNASANQYANNFSGLSDGNHTVIGYAVSTTGHKNQTEQRTITVDTTPPAISYNAGTLANNSVVNQNYVFINVSVTETNEANITFRLYNSSELVNESTLAAGNRNINFTSIADGVYYYNVTSRDNASNANTTETRTITLDTTPPSVFALEATPSTTVNVSERIQLAVNATDELSSVDAVIANITYPNGTLTQLVLLADTGNRYNTTFTAQGLIGTYTFRAIANDTLSNRNGSETTTFTVQNDVPDPSGISINEGSDITLSSGANVTVVGTATITDLNGYADISSVTGYLFLTETGIGADNNNSKHYTNSCVSNGDGEGTVVSYNCTFNVSHYAIPTDVGSNNSATNWTFTISPVDSQSTGNNGSDVVELNTLAAFTINPSIINFGELDLGANTTTINQQINVTNLGNVGLDVLLSGTNLSCNIGTVSVTSLEYEDDPFTFGSGIDLLESTVELDLDSSPGIPPHPTPQQTTYYGLGIPAVAVGGSCTGSIIITGQADPHSD